MSGVLVGVGVGPGAPDLMTLRAVRVLRETDCIAIPRRSEFDESLAWRIAKENVGEVPGQERLFLTFPMTKDPERLKPAWAKAFAELAPRLAAGKRVAFISEGDPLVYSTFIYLLEAAPEHFPGARVEVVPGVSSITAVPAAVVQPIADGQERIAVLPATYGVDDLSRVLRDFDTVLLMKVSSVMPQVVAALEQEGLLDKAVYVSRASAGAERVVRDLRTIRNDKCDYFSMVMVAKKERSGVLAGRAVAALAEATS
ncbi:precorrin-2 C(20)-methyltransferase [Pyxidicoccus fallax]|uniref:Precorrin-2 C(20)-methyltransferase n=1 Tax=Pyxidicoccus fallax TaxID=394095 RepID=A0A848LBZ6_9BACT|nr:precorrin-2 C(20)-methyltransferase [Pyxidicoccus fallax]NMO16459.1 precorrin-2 C(20)-methyltransferase [Pyxidicoccus fallax]NPC79474.1 precorrin-2 C(20)-methyltransferase [Pyxidicoccus fallax]